MNKMNNKIIDIQDSIFRQIKRLDSDSVMATSSKEEIARANAMSNSAASFIKAINLQLSIINTANRVNETSDSLQKELGLCEE